MPHRQRPFQHPKGQEIPGVRPPWPPLPASPWCRGSTSYPLHSWSGPPCCSPPRQSYPCPALRGPGVWNQSSLRQGSDSTKRLLPGQSVYYYTSAHGRYSQERNSRGVIVEYNLTYTECRAVYKRHAGEPFYQQPPSQYTPLYVGQFPFYRSPNTAGPDLTVKLHKLFLGNWFSKKCYRHPYHYGKRHNYHKPMLYIYPFYHKRHIYDHGGNKGGYLRPGVYPPPEPPQYEHKSDARRHRYQKFPRRSYRVHLQRNNPRNKHQHHRSNPRYKHIVPLGR